MDEQKAFEVAVTIQAPLDSVWAALTDPVEVRRWHGWDAPELDAEIRFIYVEHARQFPPDRIEMDDGGAGQVVELVADGSATTVRIRRPGAPAGADRYDVIEEGWVSFFQQMRDYLERHPGEERRTIFLEGKAVASELSTALDEKLPTQPWFESMFQRGVATDEYGAGLVVLSAHEPLTSDRPGAVHITLTTHGLDDAEYGAVREDWWAWWSARVEKPAETVR